MKSERQEVVDVLPTLLLLSIAAATCSLLLRPRAGLIKLAAPS